MSSMEVEDVELDFGQMGPEVKWNIMLTAYYPFLLQLCSTNKDVAGICREDVFWKQKLDRDFGISEQVQEPTWRREYDRVFRERVQEEDLEEYRIFREKVEAEEFEEEMFAGEDVLSTQDLDARSLTNLKKVARKFNLKGYSKLKKRQLIKRLQKEVPGRELLVEVNKHPVM